MNYNDLVKYVVKIQIPDNSDPRCGSGVIVNPEESEYAYVLTCKHVVKDVQCADITIQHIDNSEVKYDLECCELITIDVGKIYEEKEDGIVILILKNDEENKKHLSKIGSIGILNSRFDECVVIGYPAIHDNKKIETYRCSYVREISDSSAYEIYSEDQVSKYATTEVKSLKGLSGAGTFTKDRGGKCHIIGIQIQIKEARKLVCIDLRKIAEEINERLSEHNFKGIDLSGFSYFETLHINPNDLDFEELKKKLNNEETKKYIDNDNEIKTFKKNIESDLKILADAYLYRGIVHHQNRKNRQATNNFKNAEKYCSAHRTYFSEAITQRRNKEQLNKEQLDYAKKQIEDVLTNNSIVSEEQHISLLEQLIFINEENNLDELEKNCLTLLKLYEGQSENNIDSSLVAKKGNILEKLGDLYNKRKDYAESEKYFSESIELSKDLPEELIRRYRKLIEVLYKQEKYLEAKKCCFERLKHLKEHGKNGIQHIVTTYNDLVTIGYKLKEKDTEIYDYYQCARKELNRLPKNSKQYQRLSKIIETRWLIIKSCVIKQHISSDNELRDNIEKLKSRSEYFSEQQQFVKEQMERVEQQLGEIKESIKKLNNS